MYLINSILTEKLFFNVCMKIQLILICKFQFSNYLFLSGSQCDRFLSLSSLSSLSLFLFLSSGYQLLLEFSPWNHFLLELSSFLGFFSGSGFVCSLGLYVAVLVSSFFVFSEEEKPENQWSCKGSPDIWALYKHKTYKTWRIRAVA